MLVQKQLSDFNFIIKKRIQKKLFHYHIRKIKKMHQKKIYEYFKIIIIN